MAVLDEVARVFSSKIDVWGRLWYGARVGRPIVAKSADCDLWGQDPARDSAGHSLIVAVGRALTWPPAHSQCPSCLFVCLFVCLLLTLTASARYGALRPWLIGGTMPSTSLVVVAAVVEVAVVPQ